MLVERAAHCLTVIRVLDVVQHGLHHVGNVCGKTISGNDGFCLSNAVVAQETLASDKVCGQRAATSGANPAHMHAYL